MFFTNIFKFSNRRVVCAGPEYFETHGRPETPADLARHNCFVYSYRRWRRDWPFLGPDGREILVAVTGSVEIVKLEQNYRSQPAVLAFANQLMSEAGFLAE